MAKVKLTDLVKERIKSLKPYHVENFDCKIKLHANESPFPPPREIATQLRPSLLPELTLTLVSFLIVIVQMS